MRWLGIVLALLAPSLALADRAPVLPGTLPLEDQALEARVQALGKSLRCAVCQGMSISDSPAAMARAQLDVVRTLVKQGKSDEEIKAYFVARYGEWALLAPKTSGTNLLVWVLPAGVLFGGLAFALWYAARRTRPPAPPPASAPAEPGSRGEEDPYLTAVRAELDR